MGDTGIAMTIFLGCIALIASTAARMVAPVASPSSTRMTIFPLIVGRCLSPRYH